MMQEETFDVIVIGAGLGGLLSAAQFLERGQRVAVVERLGHVGGRFTAKTFGGAQVSTGAVHMLPFGSNGVLAAMLRDLAVPHHVFDAEVFGSFYLRGRQIPVRSMLSMARVLGPREFGCLMRLGAAMFLRHPRPEERSLSFRAWLVHQGVTRATYPTIVAFFERVSHFTLSVDLDQVSYPEVCETTKNMFRYGPPGIVAGGCAAVARALEARIRAAGGTLLLHHDVPQVLTEAGTAVGVRLVNRATGEMRAIHAPLIVSDIGGAATNRLIADAANADQSEPPSQGATGLKTHVLSKRSLIPHRGIMYCLDTTRIAGIVQPTNSDPGLAPPGEHLIISHQLWRPDRETIAEARAHALADLTRILGPQTANGWHVLTMSQYHDAWPVNRAVQGHDDAPTTPVPGLYLVGDAVKPSGYLMVEGVAQSVNVVLDLVERNGSHVAPKPSRRRALTWLVAPPAPQRQPPPPAVAEGAPLQPAPRKRDVAQKTAHLTPAATGEEIAPERID
ncbi:MAG: NAD(P)/FAD-dependent oxidoreductase [Ktedonobacterales bacterium]|nr:NAD(P)/FAD-dependent oxidoreductase [Ktedonobacterales bacterium]